MLTNDKEITKPEYWNKIYEGRNDNAKVDASNTVRPANPFDRFTWVAKLAEGPYVLEVAAGHAHISKRIREAHPDWVVVASDQAASAKEVARFTPYEIFSAYEIPYRNKQFNTIIACQCLEYMENLRGFFAEARRVSYHLIFTVPLGIMGKWSQLYEFTEENVADLLRQTYIHPVEDVLHWEKHEDLLLVKIKFNA